MTIFNKKKKRNYNINIMKINKSECVGQFNVDYSIIVVQKNIKYYL